VEQGASTLVCGQVHGRACDALLLCEGGVGPEEQKAQHLTSATWSSA
jgi:hypothetical protein